MQSRRNQFLYARIVAPSDYRTLTVSVAFTARRGSYAPRSGLMHGSE
jgi:hypothetical protein